MTIESDPKHVMRKLLAYCRVNEWAGYDPYDALNSRIVKRLPILNSRIPRLVLTQTLKRSPVNLRRLLLVPKTQNPKALALVLAALVKVPENEVADQESLIESMAARLATLRSPNNPYWCWGYSFPWQTRTVVVAAGAPNLVCTTFVAGALLDLYERRLDSRHLAMALSAADYIVNELYWSNGAAAGFSYPVASLASETHNANFLAAALLCRAWRHTGDERYLDPALTAARYSASRQNADGSWYYGEAPPQRWIDNFHTGYNLCALRSISQSIGTTEFDRCIQRGFEFYRNHFFREDGAATYYHDRAYPIDIHCVAQSIITLLAFRDVGRQNVRLADSVFRWAINHMWDERGFFYYRVLRSCTIRTSYMRWSQAWMLLAIAELLSKSDPGLSAQPSIGSAAAFSLARGLSAASLEGERCAAAGGRKDRFE